MACWLAAPRRGRCFRCRGPGQKNSALKKLEIFRPNLNAGFPDHFRLPSSGLLPGRRKTSLFRLPYGRRTSEDVFCISGRRKSEDIRLQFSRRRKTSSSIPSSGRRLPTSRRFPAHLPARLPSRRLPAFPPRLPAGLPARLPAGLPGPWLAELRWIGLAGLTACPSGRRPPAFPPSFPPLLPAFPPACLPASLPPAFPPSPPPSRRPARPASRWKERKKKRKTQHTNPKKNTRPLSHPGPARKNGCQKAHFSFFFKDFSGFGRPDSAPFHEPEIVPGESVGN